jgi:protease IV
MRAIQLGLVDKTGGLQDAIDCAARMAKVKEYSLKEYPEPQGWLETLFSGYKKNAKIKAVKEEMGEEGFNIYTSLKKIKKLVGSSQARLPFEMTIR